MPEAIATTKRKFYKALDSLNNAPVTRQAEPSTKRVRRSLSTTSTIPKPESTVNISRPDHADHKEPPNFSPWSHETFLARLKTFSSVSLWHPKPEAISEVEWAKRGWVCVGVNTVACKGGCESRVVVSLGREARSGHGKDDAGQEAIRDEDGESEDDDTSMEEALVARYKTIIARGHSESCMWRRAGCKNDIYRLQVVRPSVWQPELRNRHNGLLGISDSTRQVNFRASGNEVEVLPSTQRLFEDLPLDLLDTPNPSPTPQDSVRALDIALHGWRGSSDSGTALLQCDACFQRLGLWMYQPDYKPSRSSPDDDLKDSATIDLMEMHREHCPWRNPDTQQASGSLSGLNACQILRQMMVSYAREQRRRSNERSKAVTQPVEDDDDGEVEARGINTPLSPAPSRAEVVQQDKERESRLLKLKRVFTVKRRSGPPSKATTAGISK